MQIFTSSDSVALSAKISDRCGRHSEMTVNSEEFYEFLSVDRLAGYGSVFGDSNRLKLGLCQHCTRDVLGQWIVVSHQ